MSSTGRHASTPILWFPTRLGVTTTVAGLAALTVIAVAVAATTTGSRPAARPVPATMSNIPTANAVPAISGLGQLPGGAPSVAAPPRRATMPLPAALPLVLTAVDHRACPAAAAACVDLTRHLTWLQAGKKITFGPIQMEPGKPGSAHQTPRGTFRVEWKAGPSLVSNIYHEPMPWATFFAPGGIAFHGGSLTAWSHGCVHLTVGNAHYYNEHLPIGAEVVVF